MQIVRSFKIHLTLDDLIETLPQCTKEQLIRNFKLLLDRKQIQINDKIEKLNAQHLLILQKKVLVIEKKDEQIVKLNNSVTVYKNEIYEQKMKFSELSDELFDVKFKSAVLERKVEETESILKDEKEKKEKLRQEVEELKKLKFFYEEEQRQLKKLKDEKTLWGMETNMLLSSMNQKYDDRLNQQISFLELDFKNKESVFKERNDTLKKKNQELKKLYVGALKNIESLNRQKAEKKAKEKVQTGTKQVQTEKSAEESGEQKEERKVEYRDVVERIEKGVQAQIEEKKELRISKNELRSSLPGKLKENRTKKVEKEAQTEPAVYIQKEDKETQTNLDSTFNNSQSQIAKVFESYKKSTTLKIKNLTFKCQEMEELIEKRPSRNEDLEEMRTLQKQIVKMKLSVLQKEEELQNCKIILNQLGRSQNSPTTELQISPEKKCRRYSTTSTNFKVKPCSSREKVKSKSLVLIGYTEEKSNEGCQDEKLKEILLEKGISFQEKGFEERKKNQGYRKFKSSATKRVESIRKTTL